MIAYLEKALNVRRHEFVPASLLFFYLFLVIGSSIMGQSVGDAMFLSVFPDHLPHVIIGTALLIGAFVSVYIRLSHRVRLESLIVGYLLFFALSFALFWWLTGFGSRLVYPLIYIWVYSAGALGPTMGWTLANYVLTTREARRVFGFIGAGAILGATFAGFLTFDVTRHRHVHPETLLLGVAISLGLCAGLVKLLFRGARQRLAGLQLAPAAGSDAPRNFRQSLALLRGSRYLLLITALIAVGCAATTIIGYQFKMIARDSYGADKAALAAFFGRFNGYMALASFVLQLTLTGRLLRSFGIRVTLFVLPFVFMGGSLAVLLIPTLLAAGILKGSHTLLRFSLDKSSTELLYLPVAADIKSQVKSFIDTFIWRVADGVAGVVLWLFANVLGFTPSRISLVNLAFLLTWVAVASGVRREYLNVLRRAIERRTLDPERAAAAVLDSTTTEVLGAALERGDEQQVLYGLSLFEMGRESPWHPVLRSLLGHPSPAVRQRALRLLGDAGERQILPQVEKMLGDEAPEVRTEALHYLVVHTGRDPISLLSARTDLADYSIQGSVVAYLARAGKPEQFAAAQLILQDMVSQAGREGARVRAEAARVLGVIPPPSELHSELLRLLRDEDPEVLEQALLSAGKIQGREFLALVIEKLGTPRLAMAARAALAQYGARALGTLQDYLNDAAIPLPIRKQIPHALARIPTAESAAVLVNSLIQSDPGLRYDVLKALNKLQRRDPDLLQSGAIFEDLLNAELMGYYRSFQVLAAVDPEAASLLARTSAGRWPAAVAAKGASLDVAGQRLSAGLAAPGRQSLLTRALREHMGYQFERVFRLLALLYPARDVHNAYVGLTSGRPQLQANALEVLENLLRPDLYRQLAYVLDQEIALPEKLSFAQRLCRTSVSSKTEALRILLHSGDRWLCACAAHTVGELGLVELQQDLLRVPRDNDPLLEETCRWTGGRLGQHQR